MMKRILKILGIVLAAIACLVLALLIIPIAEVDLSAPVSGSGDWMSRLPDDISLADIAIPGTHDSGTAVCELGFITKCQFSPIAKQLSDGYRYLDVRLMAEGDEMRFMHGFTSCKTSVFGGNLTLSSVLNDCYSFLREHPTETIIFCVKNEYGGASAEDFSSLFSEYVNKSPEMWLLTGSLPTLGHARGKLVLLRRYGDGSYPGVEFDWPGQGGGNDGKSFELCNKNGFTLAVQDRYEYDIDEKWAAFTDALGAKADLTVNFLSTKGSFVQGHPFFFASNLNPRLSGADLHGWTIVDFGTAEIARTIYERNFT